jgi:ferredoxin
MILYENSTQAFRVKVDIWACIGCGHCTSCSNFVAIDGGRVKEIRTVVTDPGCISEVASLCPVHAILVEPILFGPDGKERGRGEGVLKGE